jgi:hypothetical protein
VDFLTKVKPAPSALTRTEIASGVRPDKSSIILLEYIYIPVPYCIFINIFFSWLDLIVLFGCLNTTDRKQIDATCDVLHYLLHILLQ